MDEGHPIDKQWLTCAGRQLSDEVPTAPVVYHLVLKLRGGSGDRFCIARMVDTTEVRVVLWRRFVDWGWGAPLPSYEEPQIYPDEADDALVRLADRMLHLALAEREDLLVVEGFTDAALAAYAPGAPLRGDRAAGTVLIAKVDIPPAARLAPGLAFTFEVAMSFVPEVPFSPGTRIRSEIALSFCAEIAALHWLQRLDQPRLLAWFAQVGSGDLAGENDDLVHAFSNY